MSRGDEKSTGPESSVLPTKLFELLNLLLLHGFFTRRVSCRLAVQVLLCFSTQNNLIDAVVQGLVDNVNLW